MGQCVSHPVIPNGHAASGSAQGGSSAGSSQDNQSQKLSDSATVAITPTTDLKLDSISEFYDGIAKKNPVRRSFRKTSIASLLPKVKGSIRGSKSERDNHLSATCNMSFNKFDIVMLDINTATEEELMTLTGINRNIAHEIVEHRNVIGAFKKVEDLALVSGVGAEKLKAIKPEICIRRKIPSSAASIATADASINSLNGNAETASIASSPKQEPPRRRRKDPVSVNTANIFQLMEVEGITQELAAHVLHYREKKGPFKTLYDLRKVAGFNSRLISALSPYLTIDMNPSLPISSQSNGKPLQNGQLLSNGHRRTASLPPGPLMNAAASAFVSPTTPVLSDDSPVFPSLSQFAQVLDEANSAVDATEDPLQQPSGLDEELVPCENALRLLSWNLDDLSVEKARNPGVVVVVVNLLARYHISVAVVQGVTDSFALKQLCQDINRHEKMTSNQLAYECTIVDDGIGYLHRVDLRTHDSPLLTSGNVPIKLATVIIGNLEFALVSCSIRKSESASPSTLIPQLVKTVMDVSPTERIVCFADFTHVDHSPYVEEFQALGYRPIVAKDESTSFVSRKLAGHLVHSNLLVSRYAQKALTGQWGVIRDRLTHILIPNGWSWNGPASLFHPVWLELRADENNEPGS